eukprot:2910164-Prymnesium_polylepis.1
MQPVSAANVSSEGYVRAHEFRANVEANRALLLGGLGQEYRALRMRWSAPQEAHMCNASGDIFVSVHVYKSAGSFLAEWLRAFCAVIGGRSTFWSVWGYHTMRETDWTSSGSAASSTNSASSSTTFMLAMVRDPVD